MVHLRIFDLVTCLMVWRREGDSNSRSMTLNGFQDRRLQPLGHPSDLWRGVLVPGARHYLKKSKAQLNEKQVKSGALRLVVVLEEGLHLSVFSQFIHEFLDFFLDLFLFQKLSNPFFYILIRDRAFWFLVGDLDQVVSKTCLNDVTHLARF